MLRALESVLPKGRAAAALACGYSAGAAALGLAARDRIRAAAGATTTAMEKEAGELEREHSHPYVLRRPHPGGQDIEEGFPYGRRPGLARGSVAITRSGLRACGLPCLPVVLQRCSIGC
ncbi:hypothetical protein GCM10010478_17600 [Streptomyces erythrogriseus]|uniref:Uncharacterized protein n=1 Tax=Streptomyces erythrogriseus TaxID=284027 RepID=A0ABN3WKW1_9ACTN